MTSERVRAVLLPAIALVAVLWPLSWPLGEVDGFPFSNYPMFALGREEPVITLGHVLVSTEKGLVPVPPQKLGSGTTMQAYVLVQTAIARGDAQALCERAARSVAAESVGSRGLREVIVAESRYHTLNYAAGDHTPLSRQVHARCQVPQGGAAASADGGGT